MTTPLRSSGIRKRLRSGQLIVLGSTTYPGTTHELFVPMLESTGLQRKWTIVVGISRPGVDFTGGGLEIMWTNATQHLIELDEGDAVVFPAPLLHRGRPVLEGERWILVAWAQGPALR